MAHRVIYGFRCLQRTHKAGEFMPPRTDYVTQGRNVFKNIRQQCVVLNYKRGWWFFFYAGGIPTCYILLTC